MNNNFQCKGFLINNRQPQRSDVYFADFGIGIGSEQENWRPCILIQNDIGNRFAPTTIVAPMTSAQKKPLPTHVALSRSCGLERDSVVMCEQIRTIDKSRLGRYIGTIAESAMCEIDRALLISIGIDATLLA